MPRSLWLVLVAVAMLFVSIPNLASAQHVERTDHVDGPVGVGNANTSDISTVSEDDLTAATLAAFQQIGLPDPPYGADYARQIARQKRAEHDIAFTISFVRVLVQRNGTARGDAVWINSVEGKAADAATVDHENGHRAQNRILADSDFLTDFMKLLIQYGGSGVTGLSDQTLTDMMNHKLTDLENLVFNAADRVYLEDLAKHDLNKVDQKGIFEGLAKFLRQVFDLLFAKGLAEVSQDIGTPLTQHEIQTTLDTADGILIRLALIIRTRRKYDDLQSRFEKDKNKFIDDLINGRIH